MDRIQIVYDLTFQTPFHCGTGLRAGLIDRTVVRDSEGYLYIPGSTIKGSLRMHCEGMARLYEQVDEDMRERIDSPHNSKKALWDIGNHPTMITRIFGSQPRPGRLFFDDAHQTGEDKKQYDSEEKRVGKGKYLSLQTDLSTQVRLDRPTRTAVPGALYTSEFGARDFTFQGNINGWLDCFPVEALTDGPTYSLLLLLVGLCVLERLGGNKSTGKGQCRCDIKQLHIDGEVIPEDQWRSWLDHLDVLSYYSMVASSQEGQT